MSKPESAGKSIKKPKKPYPEFPLFPHATKRWAKKIRGKTHYFGKWDDPDAALSLYLYQRDDLHAGRVPRQKDDEGIDVGELCSRFVSHKESLIPTGAITQRSLRDYIRTSDTIVRTLGARCLVSALRPDDFDVLRAAFSKGRNLTTLGNDIRRSRTIFKWCYDQGFIEHPLRFGAFKQPGAKQVRKARVQRGRVDFSQPEIRNLLDKSDGQLHAMILLGINCGFGNHDCSDLTRDKVDLSTGWHDFARQKTFIERSCSLWPETVAALKEVADIRPAARNPEHANRVFISPRGGIWVRESAEGVPSNLVARAFARLKLKCGIDRPTVGFYGLRRSHQTVGGNQDEVVVKYTMGHANDSNDMSAHYRQAIEKDRIVAVTDYIHDWLFPPE